MKSQFDLKITIKKDTKYTEEHAAQIFQTEIRRINKKLGEKNILIAEEILNKRKIPIIASDIGGIHARRILMDSISGKVILKYSKNTT